MARTVAPFLRYGHLTIETWEGDPAPMTTGAINHWAFDTPDIEAAFENAKALGVDFKDTEIQSSPSRVSGSMASATSTSTAPTARPSNSARLWRSSGSDAPDSRAICVSIVAAI